MILGWKPLIHGVFQLFQKAGLYLLLAGVGVASTGFASSGPNYITRVWQTENGVPQSTVTAVIQTRDGCLWMGTRGGLARFDGIRFTVFDSGNTPELRSPHVTSLFEDQGGTLWIGHETGEVTCYQDGEFRSVSIEAAWRGGKIFGIGADAAGDIWLFNDAGELVRVKDGLVIPALPDRVTHLLALARKPEGGFWVQRDEQVAFIEDGRLRPIPFDEPATNRYIQGIGASRDGGLWVMTENRITQWKNNGWSEDWGLAPWGWAPVHSVVETKEGHLVAATSEDGLYIVARGQEPLHFSRTNGYPDDWVTSLCEDREGNLWTGTGNSGLAMLRTANVTIMGPPDHWQGRAVLSVTAGPDDAVWVGTEGAGLYRFHDGIWSNFDETTGLGHRYIWSVAFDMDDQLWLGTWGGGLRQWDGLQFEVPAELEDITTPTPALLPLQDGSLLIGTSRGLLHYRSGEVSWLARQPEFASPDVRAIQRAADRTIWFGMSGGGLGRIRDGTVQQFRRADGLCSDFVQCLHLETDGTLWVGTYAGLNRFKEGQLTTITTEQGLPNNTICDIRRDGDWFWISSHGGIVRVDAGELNRCADGETNQIHCLSYGLSDGLPTLQCSGGFQPASCRTADGRLWFPTSKGLVVVNPEGVRTNPLAPPVIIERLLVDETIVAEAVALESPVTVAPGRHRFEFQFTGLSFTAPEKMRFKYRLDGLEVEWIEAQALRRAYYSHIPPGDYEFQVIACNNDGVWNNAGASLQLTVLPFFWQTAWFRALGASLTAIGGGVFVWLMLRRRMQRKLERLERQGALDRERTRIAKDIHDDLGARLTRISLLAESVPSDEVSPPQAAEVFDRIFTTTHEITLAMDEIVWAVNPQHDTLDSLASYLSNYAQDFLESTGVRLRLDVPLDLPEWQLDAEVRHNLFLAFKECLNNALRHAAASEIRVLLTTGDNEFTITVVDDGRGFAVEPSTDALPESGRFPGHNGLANMQQRLAEIGGRCAITSAIGKGTRVEFLVRVRPGVA